MVKWSESTSRVMEAQGRRVRRDKGHIYYTDPTRHFFLLKVLQKCNNVNIYA